MKLSLVDFKKLIKEEAEKMMSAGEPTKLKMNKMVKDEKVKGTTDKADPVKVEMNSQDKVTGSDAKVATAAEVKAAGATHNGASTKGMHKADFDSKTENPSTDASTPFEEKAGEINMEAMDKNIDDVGTKTYVEAGEAEHKSGSSVGQKKAKVSEKAQNEKETYAKIAKGIQLPESFKSQKEIVDFIKSEAQKVSKLI